DDIGTVPAVKKQVNGAPIYVVGNSVDFAKLTVNGESAITDVSNINNKIDELNNRIYIVESFVHGDSWYNKYSNGFIEQSSVILAKTPYANAVCGTLINLLIPMKTQNYGVSIDKINNGIWGDIEYSYAELFLPSLWLASYSPVAGEAWIRWTVRGY
ncbi:hypothetical protein J3U25_05655, partial [Gilliamella sp. B3493]